MLRRSRLSRQIIWSMSLVAAIVVMIFFVGTFLSFAIVISYFGPPPAPPDSIFPQFPDYIMAVIFLLIGLVVAAFFAIRLAKRILTPLGSLAEGARSIAAGDFTARAQPSDQSLGEIATLVDDFNSMAAQLQGTVEAMKSWNAAIAHELRTPLTILRGRLQGLTDGVFEPNDELFRNLLVQVEGLSRLVDDLRVVTLSDSRRLEMRFEPTDLKRQIEQTVNAMRPRIASAGFSVEIVSEPLNLCCDGVRLRQALLAMLENALRYATPGTIEVSLRTTEKDIILAVSDEGPGLGAEFEPHAFDTFSRAESSRSRQSGGSGLGLSVVRAIAVAHKGDARYRRSEMGGAIFEIVLPKNRSHERHQNSNHS